MTTWHTFDTEREAWLFVEREESKGRTCTAPRGNVVADPWHVRAAEPVWHVRVNGE